jgi:hypothetical protein
MKKANNESEEVLYTSRFWVDERGDDSHMDLMFHRFGTAQFFIGQHARGF